MLRIKCPWCGERDQTEFHYGGQADIVRPEPPEQSEDRQWAEYLFYRDNTRGLHHERWVHSWGCRQWFTVVRDTVTHEILQVCATGHTPKDVPRAEGTAAGTFGPAGSDAK